MGDEVRWWAIRKTGFIRALHPLWKVDRGDRMEKTA